MAQLRSDAADAALSILFRKLEPHLEDAAHALARGAARAELERLHLRLLAARIKAVEVLEAALATLPGEDALAEVLETLADNLTPMGETYAQSLVLTQLCLEEAPADLLPHLLPGRAEEAPWGARMRRFLARLEDPAGQAQARWAGVDEDIGETEEG